MRQSLDGEKAQKGYYGPEPMLLALALAKNESRNPVGQRRKTRRYKTLIKIIADGV